MAELDGGNLEQTQETIQPAHVASRSDMTKVSRLAADLIAELENVHDGDMVGDMIDNALKLLRDQTNRGDIKLLTKSLKELRYALKVFAPYREVRKVSIFGSARTEEEHGEYRQAAHFAKAMADLGWMVITGAGGGIMAAGHGGAGADPSFGLAIRLPHEQAANPTIARDRKLINFKYFFTRKLMFVRSSHAAAYFPGGFGTMDEAFEVLTLVQTGKSAPMPIVFVDQKGGDYWNAWSRYVQKELLGRKLISQEDLSLYRITDDVDVAVAEIIKFYHNFHSARYVRDELVIRLHRKPSPVQLAHLAAQFSDIKIKGEFRVSDALAAEKDEPGLAKLPRLVFVFNKQHFGRLRTLIDYLNTF